VHAKMIFMLLSISYDRFQERTGNFEQHAQTKSKNPETCPRVMISYVQAAIKILECLEKVAGHCV
jgi:hypothetical protein